jgi:multicomponent Na+:H+ antiporter subunit A
MTSGMSSETLRVTAILSPFFFIPAAGWIGRQGVRRARLLSLLPALLFAYYSYAFATVAVEGPLTVSVPWAPSLGLSMSFRLDGLSLLFAALITGIGALIVLYAARYFDQHADAGGFQATLFAFMGSMLGVVLSDSLLALFVFWELTGFTSYLLIGFEHDRRDARRAALQALLVTGAGGLALLAAAVMIGQAGGSVSLSALLAGRTTLTSHAAYGPIVGLVLLAAFTKSAQFPFHFWLPNAMQAPTPVSAYLHSATMVKAGVYLIARMTPILGGTLLWTGIITVVGAATMVGGAYRATLETDLKRVLAYSTIGALGVIVLLLGIGTPDAVLAGLTYLVAHACYKGALFLVAGAVEHEAGTRDVTALGGLRRTMPMTATAAALATGSMIGVPLALGFVAKELFYDSVQSYAPFGASPGVVLAAAVVASAFLGAAGLIAGVSPFFGRLRTPQHTQEAPPDLWLGPFVLAGVGVVAGLAPALLEAPLTLAAGSILPTMAPVHLALWHGLTVTLALSAVTLITSVGLFTVRGTFRQLAWPGALGTERLYTGSLSYLDAISDRVAPALQGASIRSYVMTIVVTMVAFVGTALATGRILPALIRWTPIRLHEAAVAALICAAAISAACARSNTAAVLSLGTVGYGIALIYVLFGAPDLAMTQFAVETLTVVIFVLVFYQLRGFGDLSSRLVKVRDAVIAGAAGTIIVVLVLYIGASGTTSRLSSFFVDAAPALGHGRNVVNVILVDFRGFDTLGEITVLVTVALGVRALLRIGKAHQP